eukprot:scaffold638_cov168-Amphora_coffeaeformis.AAC.5
MASAAWFQHQQVVVFGATLVVLLLIVSGSRVVEAQSDIFGRGETEGENEVRYQDVTANADEAARVNLVEQWRDITLLPYYYEDRQVEESLLQSFSSSSYYPPFYDSSSVPKQTDFPYHQDTAGPGYSQEISDIPGAFYARHGESCNDVHDPREGSTLSIRMSGSALLPSHVNQATVILNGWRLNYGQASCHRPVDQEELDEKSWCYQKSNEEFVTDQSFQPTGVDHHVHYISAFIRSIWYIQRSHMLFWRVEGRLTDHNYDDPYAFCYHYTILGWNEQIVKAKVLGGSNIEEKMSSVETQDLSQDDSSLFRSSGIISRNNVFTTMDHGPVALVPLGFEFLWHKFVDHELLQIAYKYDPGPRSYNDPNIYWSRETIYKDNRVRNYQVFEWITAIVGTQGPSGSTKPQAIQMLHPPMTIVESKYESDANACISTSNSWKVREYKISNVPLDIAIPVLTGWELGYECGDQHVGHIGTWIDNIAYDRPVGSPTGTLSYRVVQVLRDQDGNPGYYPFKARVSILGFAAPRPRVRDVTWDAVDVAPGFMTVRPTQIGKIQLEVDYGDYLKLEGFSIGGPFATSFDKVELIYQNQVVAAESLPTSPITVWPGDEVLVTVQFTVPSSIPWNEEIVGWVDFTTNDSAWPVVRVGLVNPRRLETPRLVIPNVAHQEMVFSPPDPGDDEPQSKIVLVSSDGGLPLLIEEIYWVYWGGLNPIGFSVGIRLPFPSVGNIRYPVDFSVPFSQWAGWNPIQIDPGQSIEIEIEIAFLGRGVVSANERLVIATSGGTFNVDISVS